MRCSESEIHTHTRPCTMHIHFKQLNSEFVIIAFYFAKKKTNEKKRQNVRITFGNKVRRPKL